MTELIWNSKYKDGKKVEPVRIALPFQTVEIVNQETQQGSLVLQPGQKTGWYNRLIWGDKKYVLPSLLPEFAGKVNLIYIDPPFATGTDFSFTTTISESEENFTGGSGVIERKAYRDTWGKGLDGYLQWFYETAVLLHELLAEDGSIYVHIDWRVNSAVRLIMDEIFGSERFFNEIIWYYSQGGKSSRYFAKKHDTILAYSKTDAPTFNAKVVRLPYTPHKQDALGRNYGGRMGIDEDGREYVEKWGTGKQKLYRYYLDEGKLPEDVWTDIQSIQSAAGERVAYATQKPEALLERIIKASSNEGDLVLDCFCGSGTTAAVAEKLGRRWIACDLGRFAIHTTHKRLLSIPNAKPFIGQNLGKYERQVWQTAEFSHSIQSTDAHYRSFILQLYHAVSFDGYTWLHGVKADRLVHVGSVDASIDLGEVKAIIHEFRKFRDRDGSHRIDGIDILGWDFAVDLNDTTKQLAADLPMKLAFKRIPREVLEKKAVEQGDLCFYELATLSLNVQRFEKIVEVELQDFFMPSDDVPEDVQRAIKHWSQWIDYWAVDWDYRDDTFHNQWQSYRTRKDPKLLLKAVREYNEAGIYTIVIKIIDILGNEITKALTVDVR